jgi:hypothetical protein
MEKLKNRLRRDVCLEFYSWNCAPPPSACQEQAKHHAPSQRGGPDSRDLAKIQTH